MNRLPGIIPVLLATLAAASAQTIVAPPTITPNGGTAVAPLAVKLQCATPGAAIHVTTDGAEPTELDMEFDPGATILLDNPATMKARAFLPDGRSSAVASAVFHLQPAPGDGAYFLDQEVPLIMAAGRSYRAALTFRNIGSVPWTPSTHQLIPARAGTAEVWTKQPVAPEAETATWQESEFSFAVTAPAKPGRYAFSWRVAPVSGQPIGEASPVKRILVLDPDADPDRDGVPNWAELELGTKYDVADSDLNGTPDGAEDFDGDGKPDAAELLASAGVEPKAAAKLTDAETEAKLVSALQSGTHTYQQLRAMGFKFTDAEFDAFIKARPQLFLATKAARKDEKGQAAMPGTPAVARRFNPKVAKLTDPVVRKPLVAVLKNSAHSFKHLRASGFDYPDEDFTALIAAAPKEFSATRIIRRDEKGQRIIPGWPAIKLRK